MFWCTNPSVPPCPRTLSDPFRCGSLITEGVRTVFRYERNNTSNSSFTDFDLTSLNISEEMPDFLSNSSNTMSELKDMVNEELIIPQMMGMTRIVNGEDCPPGECPWQVINLHN